MSFENESGIDGGGNTRELDKVDGFYNDRKKQWEDKSVRGCDAGAALGLATDEDLASIGEEFAEVLALAHTKGPKTVFDALHDSTITQDELNRYLATSLAADGGRWELFSRNPEVSKDFSLQAKTMIDLLSGKLDDRMGEYTALVNEQYFPEPVESFPNLLVFDDACTYPFLRGLRDGVNHQVQYLQKQGVLIYSYMGNDADDALCEVVEEFRTVKKKYPKSLVVLEGVSSDDAQRIVHALLSSLNSRE